MGNKTDAEPECTMENETLEESSKSMSQCPNFCQDQIGVVDILKAEEAIEEIEAMAKDMQTTDDKLLKDQTKRNELWAQTVKEMVKMLESGHVHKCYEESVRKLFEEQDAKNH